MMSAMRLAQSLHFRRFLSWLCDGHGCSYLPRNVWQRRWRKSWIGLCPLRVWLRLQSGGMSVTVAASGRGASWVVSDGCDLSWCLHASTSFQQHTDRNENQLLFSSVGQNPVPHADECFPAICVLPEWNQQRPACCSRPLCARSSLPGAGCQSVQPSMITGRRSMGEKERDEGKKEMLVYHLDGSLSKSCVITCHI